jgi:hypothetical protein
MSTAVMSVTVERRMNKQWQWHSKNKNQPHSRHTAFGSGHQGGQQAEQISAVMMDEWNCGKRSGLSCIEIRFGAFVNWDFLFWSTSHAPWLNHLALLFVQLLPQQAFLHSFSLVFPSKALPSEQQKVDLQKHHSRKKDIASHGGRGSCFGCCHCCRGDRPESDE